MLTQLLRNTVQPLCITRAIAILFSSRKYLLGLLLYHWEKKGLSTIIDIPTFIQLYFVTIFNQIIEIVMSFTPTMNDLFWGKKRERRGCLW